MTTTPAIAAIISAITDELEYLMVTRDWPHDQRLALWRALEVEAMCMRTWAQVLETPTAGHRAPKRRAGRMGGKEC